MCISTQHPLMAATSEITDSQKPQQNVTSLKQKMTTVPIIIYLTPRYKWVAFKHQLMWLQSNDLPLV
jgi:hypothetical protein